MTQATDFEAFAAKFRLADLTIAETGGWTLSLRPAQITLGSMVLSVKSGARDLAALTASEAQGMAAGFGLAERAARSVYGAVRINILCLMMQDPFVHFHILPRYDAVVERHGTEWADADWPGPPVIRPVATPPELLQALHAELAGWARQAGNSS